MGEIEALRQIGERGGRPGGDVSVIEETHVMAGEIGEEIGGIRNDCISQSRVGKGGVRWPLFSFSLFVKAFRNVDAPVDQRRQKHTPMESSHYLSEGSQ